MPRRSSSLLINEPPLQALPSLAALVGINGAIILQQFHYWLIVSEHKIEGHTWIYNSYEAWSRQFKWLSWSAVQKHILNLERAGLLISKQYKYKTKKNTKWYRIDYDRLEEEFTKLEDHAKSNGVTMPKVADTMPKVAPNEAKNQTEYHKNTHKNRNKDNNEKKPDEIWTSVLELLKSEISPPNFRTWLKDTVPLTFDGETFVVGVKNSFVAEYLHKNQRSIIERNLCRVLGRSGVFFECLVSPVKGSKGNEKTENRRPRR